ncbi:hypothetical protein ACFLXC_03520 [Chloroflexota bacterium]
MNIIDRLRAKYHHTIEKKYIKGVKRKQFNMMVSPEIITTVKYLASILHVPRYVITEHLLQVGSYHVLRDITDLEKRQKLTEHFLKVHLLGDELKEDEVLFT